MGRKYGKFLVFSGMVIGGFLVRGSLGTLITLFSVIFGIFIKIKKENIKVAVASDTNAYGYIV